eukprot:CAMPEP_0175133550 /NCGR_PEP_ID=MMETSP0087-20121206/7709_1 /TAXON_ID=136419 /ORGANISM="Unknown Unknown, Strain D1" /LENGTH=807 /DNA_ID=CAMNT_0016416061 /DNA_START=104 /DNA_END=2527 /DNA_ORIENTATION=+
MRSEASFGNTHKSRATSHAVVADYVSALHAKPFPNLLEPPASRSGFATPRSRSRSPARSPLGGSRSLAQEHTLPAIDMDKKPEEAENPTLAYIARTLGTALGGKEDRPNSKVESESNSDRTTWDKNTLELPPTVSIHSSNHSTPENPPVFIPNLPLATLQQQIEYTPGPSSAPHRSKTRPVPPQGSKTERSQSGVSNRKVVKRPTSNASSDSHTKSRKPQKPPPASLPASNVDTGGGFIRRLEAAPLDEKARIALWKKQREEEKANEKEQRAQAEAAKLAKEVEARKLRVQEAEKRRKEKLEKEEEAKAELAAKLKQKMLEERKKKKAKAQEFFQREQARLKKLQDQLRQQQKAEEELQLLKQKNLQQKKDQSAQTKAQLARNFMERMMKKQQSSNAKQQEELRKAQAAERKRQMILNERRKRLQDFKASQGAKVVPQGGDLAKQVDDGKKKEKEYYVPVAKRHLYAQEEDGGIQEDLPEGSLSEEEEGQQRTPVVVQHVIEEEMLALVDADDSQLEKKHVQVLNEKARLQARLAELAAEEQQLKNAAAAKKQHQQQGKRTVSFEDMEKERGRVTDRTRTNDHGGDQSLSVSTTKPSLREEEFERGKLRRHTADEPKLNSVDGSAQASSSSQRGHVVDDWDLADNKPPDFEEEHLTEEQRCIKIAVADTKRVYATLLDRPLKPKVLKRPPFRVIHAMFLESMTRVGFLKGVCPEQILQAEFVQTKAGRFAFCQWFLQQLAPLPEGCKNLTPVKILTGTAPLETNVFLQHFAQGALCVVRDAVLYNRTPTPSPRANRRRFETDEEDPF